MCSSEMLSTSAGPCAPHPLQGREDIISDMLSYCAPNEFLFLAGVSASWKSAWEALARPKATSINLAASTRTRTEWIVDHMPYHHAAARQGGIFCLATRAGNLGGLKAAAEEYGPGWTLLGVVKYMTELAAEEGHVDILRWAKAQGCRLSDELCSCAIRGGHLKVLEYARQEGCSLGRDTCLRAAEGGHLDILKWAREQGCSWNPGVCSAAAYGNYFDLLRWAQANGCPWDRETCSFAALNGNLSMLAWAKGLGCPWDERTCSFAALDGNLDVLQWAKENGCPWNSDTCTCAVQGGHLDVLKWAREEGCPWDLRKCASIAKARRFAEIVVWLDEGARGDST